MHNTTIDPLTYGQMLIDLGTALLTGRMQIVDSQSLSARMEITTRDVAHERAYVSQDALGGTIASADHSGDARVARPGARGGWSPRKGYHIATRVKGSGKVDLAGVTPAGVRLLEYVERHPGKSAAGIADDLGLSRKTVENLLSLLRQRHLIVAGELNQQ